MRITTLAIATILVGFGPTAVWSQEEFIRGDCNNNGVVNFVDAYVMAVTAFSGFPPCEAACDFDDVSNSPLIDAVLLVSFLFMDTPPPALPFPNCGFDTTPESAPSCNAGQCDEIVAVIDPAFLLHIDDTVGSSGVEAEVRVHLDNDVYVAGWSFGVCHDSAVATVIDVIPGLDAAPPGEEPHFAGSHIEDGGWTAMGVRSLLFPDLAAGLNNEVAVSTYLPIGEVGDSTPLNFCETLGTPLPVRIRVVQDFGDKIPVVANGTLTVVEGFRRGDVNGDGVAASLTDALFALVFGFSGGPPLICDDAGDFDDNGQFSAIIDALGILNYAFLNAAPPPSPGVQCGPDPTPDLLDCQNQGSCL